MEKKKYYIEEHVFRGDISSSFFIVSYVGYALGLRLKELANEDFKLGYDQYFDHTDEVIPAPEWNSTPNIANFHFALAVDKGFKLNKNLDNEANWFVTKLFNNKEFISEVEAIRNNLGSIQDKVSDPFKQALSSNPFLGPIIEMNLKRYDISLKDGALMLLAFPRVEPLMKKFSIPDEYVYLVMQIILSGFDLVKTTLGDWFDLSYFNYFGSVPYMVQEPRTGFKYIQNYIVKQPELKFAARTAPIIKYFQKHFFVNTSKTLKPVKYEQFIKLFDLDKQNKLKDKEIGKIVYGDCGKDKSKNVAKLRKEMKKDLER